MIARRIQTAIQDRLEHLPAVALLGPRQVGKTTLAHTVAEGRKSIYLDLELPQDREKLTDAAFYLSGHEDELVILDEVQRVPELFATLRGLIDQGRRRGRRAGRFLLLGSASLDLLRQSESLAGRIAYMELSPITALPDEYRQTSGEIAQSIYPR
jgi:predicted AAA+ superfamily ATPase